MKITICSHTFEVTYEDPSMWNFSGMGRSNLQTGKIAIRGSMPKDVRDSTLLHEVIHMIADIADLKIKDNENEISALAAMLLDFLRRNPEAVKELCSES